MVIRLKNKLEKLMKIFLILFLISLFMTIGLAFIRGKQPIDQTTVAVTVVNNEDCHSFLHNLRGPRRTSGRNYDRRYHVTVRYMEREDTWCLPNMTGGFGSILQAYISPDGSLAVDETMARNHSPAGKLYFVFLFLTGALFLTFIGVYDKIWRIKQEKK